VTYVDDPPTASDQSVTTPQDTPVAIPLLGSDPENDPLTWTIDTPPAHGTLSGAAPNLTYTPDAGYAGADSFAFHVSDCTSSSASATVSITVMPMADATIKLEARDQFGSAASPALIGCEISLQEDGVKYPVGTPIPLTIGQTYHFRGHRADIVGPVIAVTVTAATTEISVPFQTVTFHAVDQNAATVAGAVVEVGNPNRIPYALGTPIAFPQDGQAYIRTRVLNVQSSSTLTTFVAGVPDLYPQFWTATLKAADLSGPVAGAKVGLQGVTGSPFAAETAVSLPKGVLLRMNGVLGGVSSTYTMFNFQTTSSFTAAFRTIPFTAVKADGSTPVAGAEVEIGSLGRAASGANRSVPVPCSLGLNAYLGASLIGSAAGVSVTTGTTQVKVVTNQ